jgi:Arc/MetJ-type ribon-helix-helix transcriptional regulator
MKTIAITIDEVTERLLDELAAASPRPHNRSSLVRKALREFAERERRRLDEGRESRIVRKHRDRLRREAKALVTSQARP